MTIDYTLGNAGWAEARIADGVGFHTMTVSYLHDSLGELTSAINLLLQHVTEAKVLFMDEPGEHMMLLQIDDENSLHIEIRWFEEHASWDLTTEKNYRIVFKSQCSLFHFASEVLRNLEKIFREHGITGYKEKWINSEFPLRGLEKLKELLVKFNRI